MSLISWEQEQKVLKIGRHIYGKGFQLYLGSPVENRGKSYQYFISITQSDGNRTINLWDLLLMLRNVYNIRTITSIEENIEILYKEFLKFKKDDIKGN